MTVRSEVSGYLLFDKPKGWTSHDAAQLLRSRLPGKAKVGHTGTLDPMATGLLVLLVGGATRRQAELQKQAKDYRGRIRLGVTTDTGDAEGKVLKSAPVPPLTLEEVRAAAGGMTGALTLPAPVFSAVKHKGKPLYYYARKGVEVPRKDREMEVRRWDVASFEPPELEFEMEVGSGTYVRALAEALGEKLGCGACVTELRRTRVGAFRVEDAVTAEAVKAMGAERLAASVLPLRA